MTAPFVGRWRGAQYVRGTRADGAPHYEPPVTRTVRIGEDEGGVFLEVHGGRLPLFVLGPNAAVIQAGELAGVTPDGVRYTASMGGGSVHLVRGALVFSCGATIKREDETPAMTAFFVFEGERVDDDAPADPRDLH